jgi:hypothetical protein
MKFSEYANKKEQKELLEFLVKNNVDLSEVNINILLESGWWDATKRGLRTGALLATMPAISGANWTPPKELPNPRPYHFSAEKFVNNQQGMKDEKADKAYINAGGPEFKQTLEDAEKYVKFKKTPENQEILKRAGLPSNYIPSSIRSFVYGDIISTASEYSQETANVIQGEIKKHFGREMSARFVRSEDSVTGGTRILIDIVGTVMAFDENDAIKRVETVVREIAKDRGFSLDGFQDINKHHGIEVRPASRSTIDFVQKENSGARPIKIAVRVTFLVRQSKN